VDGNNVAGLRIVNFDARWRRIFSVTLRLFYPVLTGQKTGFIPDAICTRWLREKSCPFQESNLGCQDHNQSFYYVRFGTFTASECNKIFNHVNVEFEANVSEIDSVSFIRVSIIFS
jgi:hypothetical protein